MSDSISQIRIQVENDEAAAVEYATRAENVF